VFVGFDADVALAQPGEFAMPRFFYFLLAVALIFTNLPAYAEFKIKSFDSGGTKLFYFTEGKGEPVVLIHGWLSSAGVNWALPGISAEIAKNFQVIAIDVRGHGISEKPVKPEAYGLELVEDVVRLLDHLEIKKAHIVGYSMGGFITAKLLSKHPKRCLSGTLCASGWLRVGSLEQKVFAGDGKAKDAAGMCFQSIAQLAMTEAEFKAISVPTACIIGSKDFLKGLYVTPAAKLHPSWPVVEVKDGDHLTCILKPQFREEIVGWLKKRGK
jgi:pimeloyl-ACP methyl ester carboxylesterase